MGESLQIQLKKGVLEMCLLALLSKGDNYAYDIASRMAEAVGMGEGTIYPLMRRMQNDGLAVERRRDRECSSRTCRARRSLDAGLVGFLRFRLRLPGRGDHERHFF